MNKQTKKPTYRKNTIKDSILRERDVWSLVFPKGKGPNLLHEFLLRNGQEYKGEELSGYKPRPIKLCFANARAMVLNTRANLRYCEGVIRLPGLPLLIHHAWNLDAGGRVVDTTLREAATAEYFGIWFAAEHLQGRYCLLEDIDFMLAFDPGFQAVIDGNLYKLDNA